MTKKAKKTHLVLKKRKPFLGPSILHTTVYHSHKQTIIYFSEGEINVKYPSTTQKKHLVFTNKVVQCMKGKKVKRTNSFVNFCALNNPMFATIGTFKIEVPSSNINKIFFPWTNYLIILLNVEIQVLTLKV